MDLTNLKNLSNAPKELHDYINWLEKYLKLQLL